MGDCSYYVEHKQYSQAIDCIDEANSNYGYEIGEYESQIKELKEQVSDLQEQLEEKCPTCKSTNNNITLFGFAMIIFIIYTLYSFYRLYKSKK